MDGSKKGIWSIILRAGKVAILLTLIIMAFYFAIKSSGYKFNFTKVFAYTPAFNKGLILTLIIVGSSMGISVALGTIIGLAGRSNIVYLSDLAKTYVQVLRNIPLMVIILALYFGIGSVFTSPPPLFWGIVALTIFEASYIAEIVRGGIESIPVEQRESADALAMNYYQKMRYVILPQAFRNIIPALTGQLVMLIKDSSLLMVIGVMELTRQSRYLLSVTFSALEVYIITILYYFAICFPLAMLSRYLEKKLAIEEVS